METSSQNQTDRAVFSFRGSEGHATTMIVMPKRGQVWLVFPGADKTTAAMTDAHATSLIKTISATSRGPR